jgi:hypothetical protein
MRFNYPFNMHFMCSNFPWIIATRRLIGFDSHNKTLPHDVHDVVRFIDLQFETVCWVGLDFASLRTATANAATESKKKDSQTTTHDSFLNYSKTVFERNAPGPPPTRAMLPPGREQGKCIRARNYGL